MHLYIYLYIYLSIYISSCLSTYQSIYEYIYLSVSIISFYLSFYLSIFLACFLSIHHSINLSFYLFIYMSIFISIFLSTYLCTTQSFYQSFHLCIYLFIFLSFCLSFPPPPFYTIYRTYQSTNQYIYPGTHLYVYLSTIIALWPLSLLICWHFLVVKRHRGNFPDIANGFPTPMVVKNSAFLFCEEYSRTSVLKKQIMSLSGIYHFSYQSPESNPRTRTMTLVKVGLQELISGAGSKWEKWRASFFSWDYYDVFVNKTTCYRQIK